MRDTDAFAKLALTGSILEGSFMRVTRLIVIFGVVLLGAGPVVSQAQRMDGSNPNSIGNTTGSGNPVSSGPAKPGSSPIPGKPPSDIKLPKDTSALPRAPTQPRSIDGQSEQQRANREIVKEAEKRVQASDQKAREKNKKQSAEKKRINKQPDKKNSDRKDKKSEKARSTGT